MTTAFTPVMMVVTAADDVVEMQMITQMDEAEGWRGWMMSRPWMDMLGELVVF